MAISVFCTKTKCALLSVHYESGLVGGGKGGGLRGAGGVFVCPG
jgi:hypothetical protein